MITLYKWLISLFTKSNYGKSNKELFDHYQNEMKKGTIFYANEIKRKFVITAVYADEYFECVRIDAQLIGDIVTYGVSFRVETFHRKFKPTIRLKANLK